MWMCVIMVVYVDESVYVGVHGSMCVCVCGLCLCGSAIRKRMVESD